MVRVKFSIASGFDDKTKSVEKVGPGAWKARSLYLYVPDEVSYMDQGKRKTKSIDIGLTGPAIVPDQELKGLPFLPVVNLIAPPIRTTPSRRLCVPSRHFDETL